MTHQHRRLVLPRRAAMVVGDAILLIAKPAGCLALETLTVPGGDSTNFCATGWRWRRPGSIAAAIAAEARSRQTGIGTLPALLIYVQTYRSPGSRDHIGDMTASASVSTLYSFRNLTKITGLQHCGRQPVPLVQSRCEDVTMKKMFETHLRACLRCCVGVASGNDLVAAHPQPTTARQTGAAVAIRRQGGAGGHRLVNAATRRSTKG